MLRQDGVKIRVRVRVRVRDSFKILGSQPLGVNTGLVEADETAVGKRKYHRGKRQRQAGTQWVQTALEVQQHDDGSRTLKRLRAQFLEDRCAETLQGDLANWLSDGAQVQTDGWKGYSSIDVDKHMTW